MFTKSLALFATSFAIALAVVACGPASTPVPAGLQAQPVDTPIPVSTPGLPSDTTASPVNTPMPEVAPALPTDTPLPTAEATYAPVTVESCTAFKDEEGEIQTGTASYIYPEPPTRAITLNQHVTEIMLALELQDHMVGTAYIDDEILPQYQSAYQSIPVLAEEYPSREVILAQNPDFIYGGFLSAFGDGAAGSQDVLNGLDIGTYLTSAICNAGSADTLDDVYADIRAIGDIFGVADRADALVQAMSEEVAAAAPQAASPGDPLRVFIFDSGDDSPYTAVCCSMFTNMIETAGGSNVFDDVDGRWKSVSWEEVIDRDPELIVLTEADWSTSQEKIDLLLGDPALADITAVKEQRFVVLQFSSLVPGIRNAAAIAELAEAVGQ